MIASLSRFIDNFLNYSRKFLQAQKERVNLNRNSVNAEREQPKLWGWIF